jgi:hypothetical protein
VFDPAATDFGTAAGHIGVRNSSDTIEQSELNTQIATVVAAGWFTISHASELTGQIGQARGAAGLRGAAREQAIESTGDP